MTQSPPCANRDIPSDTPTVDAQLTKKTHQMEFKYTKSPPRRECMGWSLADLGITVLPVVIVRPYILDPQHMHIPKRELVSRLEWFMSPSNSTISQQQRM